MIPEGGSPLGPPLLAAYGDAGTLATTTHSAILALFTAVFLPATWAVLKARCHSGAR